MHIIMAFNILTQWFSRRYAYFDQYLANVILTQRSSKTRVILTKIHHIEQHTIFDSDFNTHFTAY